MRAGRLLRDGKRQTTLRSVRDALVRVRAASGAGVEVTTPRGTPGLRIWALPTSPGTCELATDASVPTPDAIDAPRRRNKAPRDAPPTRKNV